MRSIVNILAQVFLYCCGCLGPGVPLHVSAHFYTEICIQVDWMLHYNFPLFLKVVQVG